MEREWEYVEFDHSYASIFIKEEPLEEILHTELIFKEEISNEYKEPDQYVNSGTDEKLLHREFIKEEISYECNESDQYINSETVISNANVDEELLHTELIIKEERSDEYNESDQYLNSETAIPNATVDDYQNYIKNEGSYRLYKSSFECQLCGQKFIKYTNLRRHQRLYCVYSVQSDVKSNKRSSIGNYNLSNGDLELKSFNCKICNKGFSNKLSVMAHEIKEHVGEKYFTCIHCQRTFNNKYYLLLHNSQIHPTDKPKFRVKWRCKNEDKLLYNRCSL